MRAKVHFFFQTHVRISSSGTETKVCHICKKNLDNVDDSNISKIFQKGADIINDPSRKRGRDDVAARTG